MGKLEREVTITAEDGKAMTSGELMMACSQVPGDIVPKFDFNWNGTVRRVKFKVAFVPG